MENNKRLYIKNKNWWHVRKYYKSGHAALIVGESAENYYFLNITKHPPSGYAHIETKKPINLGKEKSYIRLYLQKGTKKRFSKWKMKYEFAKEDLDKIDIYFK